MKKKDKKTDINKNVNININVKPTNSNLNFNDFEMNNLPYDSALKFDKRTYFQYYLSLIRTKHIFFLHFILIMIIIL